MHQVKPAKEGDLCYARLWVGTTENGGEVQALIFGLALTEDCDITQADVELAAVPPPASLAPAYPPVVVAPDAAGKYTPPWRRADRKQ
jgi:hypothetical protein